MTNDTIVIDDYWVTLDKSVKHLDIHMDHK